MRAVDVIIKKKNNITLSEEEINFMIDGFTTKKIPDYQMSAFLMAIIFNPLNSLELFYFTKAMLNSGEVIDLSNINGICVDKHSTGGVGDKTTLVIAPILATLNLKVAKMSGRGLGHTGGTLDKLESIPNFNISLTKDAFIKQVNEIGLSVVGQTANIAPADKLLYALRDVTGTVESVGLIASSIMSKKLASGSDTIILDVKTGDGAFMKTIEDARNLALAMCDIGSSFNKKVIAMITDMDEPLGYAIGNSLEVIEAIETLKGNGPADLTEICYAICSNMLEASLGINQTEANKLIKDSIESGKALNKLKEMIDYQGGNSEVINNYQLFKQAKEVIEVRSCENGFVAQINTLDLGVAAMLLGAGRSVASESINPSVGLKFYPKKGDYIEKDQVIALVYTDGVNTENAIEVIKKSISYSDKQTPKTTLIKDIINFGK